MRKRVPPSSSGLGCRPLTAVTGVRIPLGVPFFALFEALPSQSLRPVEVLVIKFRVSARNPKKERNYRLHYSTGHGNIIFAR